MYPTPMYRAAISRTALPTALAGMTPPVCAARAGVGAGGGGGGSAVTVIATVSKVQVAPAGTCTTGAVVRAIRADAVSALVSTAGTSGLLVSMLSGAAVADTPVEHTTVPSVDTSALTASARIALTTAPVVQVPAGATWTFDTVPISVTADPPPPPPPARTPARAAQTVSVIPASAVGRAAPSASGTFLAIGIVSGFGRALSGPDAVSDLG